ncbi:hypothetical protein EDD98_0819 [Streptomyces sp. PanSC19]|uniref:hypothetical protein n=1 Tax=Streptomyces sp. PanSC19 TaxID=1520455 RepID=UPI000F472E00|nr:hypothetical protein [Streptomyces sp. PanSC19]ROQ31856.1 hypothetical protein EDD98_0819 [Streptomyces sp. PanSC19]
MSGTENVRRRRNVIAASVAAGVLLAGGGGVYLAATASGDARPDGAAAKDAGGPPPPLRLGSGGSGGSGGPGIAPGEPDPSGGAHGTVYKAKGPLPQGPSSAAVHRPEGLVTSAEVTRLAEALGVEGRPELVGDVWTIRPEKDGSGPRLDVMKAAPGSWTYSWYDGGPVGDACLKGPACPPPGAAKPPASGRTPVSEAAAKAAAAPVLKALGQDDAKVSADQVMDGSVRVVNADPVVDGLPTYGWSTGLRIGPDGRPVSGSGTLKEPAKGATYPVVGAVKALAELNEKAKGAGPVGIGGCATDPPAGVEGSGGGGPAPVDGSGKADPAAPCRPTGDTAPPTEVPVTGAVFGLAAQDVAGERVLVPAWLFTADPVDAAPYTVTETAVAPEYLAPVKPSPDEGTAPARRIESYRTAEDGRKLSVTFWGGVCSTYTAKAVESPAKVSVRIDEKSNPGRACIAIAKEITLTVELQSPLGGRPVVDAASGESVPRR